MQKHDRRNAGYAGLAGSLATTAVLAAASILFPATAQAADAEAGSRVATQWCTACHTTSAAKGGDIAPTFEQLANRPDFDPAALRAFLATPHPPMESLSLTRIEIDNLIAYLGTFRKP